MSATQDTLAELLRILAEGQLDKRAFGNLRKSLQSGTPGSRYTETREASIRAERKRANPFAGGK